jgi:UDP-N-acetylmuramate--alanine ligase
MGQSNQNQDFNFKFLNSKIIYFIGIKGAGMSALALIYKKLGAKVLGSDVKENFFSDNILKKEKITILEGFKTSNIPKNCDFIICSNAFLNNENPEFKKANELGLAVLSYAEGVALLFNNCFGIAIAGSHGKTTTTAMVAEIIRQANLPLIALVGSEVLNWKSNALVKVQNYNFKSKFKKMPIFVLEADEYKEAFLNYQPKILLITNIDWDHPDYFKKEIDYLKAFKKIIAKTLANGGKVIFSKDAQKALGDLIYQSLTFKKNKNLIVYTNQYRFNLKIAGDFNQYNANGAYLVAKELKIKDSLIKKALANFCGTARRMQKHLIKIPGLKSKITIIDDYAHHPTEIKHTIEAIKKRYKNRKIWLFFQPHTFSRTKAYFYDFISALKVPEKLSIVETFSSAREKKGFLAKNLVKKIKGALYHKTVKEAALYLAQFYKSLNANALKSFGVPEILKKSDNYLIVTMGAGNINKLINHLKDKK